MRIAELACGGSAHEGDLVHSAQLRNAEVGKHESAAIAADKDALRLNVAMHNTMCDAKVTTLPTSCSTRHNASGAGMPGAKTVSLSKVLKPVYFSPDNCQEFAIYL
jgi:hypothetical protein